ncbi:hypothetical protein H4O18_00615 [Arenibacter sp. BSSL-BM3]|uniref:Uncharacterized protein n=1 Tax=Arenibacter arenosicollis TaxID=2762274 RepID=A0ABR7QH21_9FLAO|nr:hypothetical protein [Arenibacter arenosicollis]MBC8766480.1 hypothetical protein [Arenibacter arenosicollis]
MKYNHLISLLLLTLSLNCFSQTKPEREHRIKKSQFPSLEFEALPLEDAKKLRYYKEVDSSKTTYTLKFRKRKMHYHIDFNEKGTIQKTGFSVSEVDIPTDTYANINSFLRENFKQTKIKYIQQCYPGTSDDVLKNTFQNLILPHNTYKLMFRGKKSDEREDFIAIFDAEGNLIKIAMALPANYDRVLY